MADRRRQKRAKPALGSIDRREISAPQKTFKEALGQVLGVLWVFPSPPDVGINRIPVDSAQFGQSVGAESVLIPHVKKNGPWGLRECFSRLKCFRGGLAHQFQLCTPEVGRQACEEK